MTRSLLTRLIAPLSIPLAIVALPLLLSGCVAYPAYDGGYYAPAPYIAAPVVIGGGWRGGHHHGGHRRW